MAGTIVDPGVNVVEGFWDAHMAPPDPLYDVLRALWWNFEYAHADTISVIPRGEQVAITCAVFSVEV